MLDIWKSLFESKDNFPKEGVYEVSLKDPITINIAPGFTQILSNCTQPGKYKVVLRVQLMNVDWRLSLELDPATQHPKLFAPAFGDCYCVVMLMKPRLIKPFEQSEFRDPWLTGMQSVWQRMSDAFNESTESPRKEGPLGKRR